ncbi:DedA family protein [Georgenia satyanarayanai]|uniref:DedA family protein n=1 Tax=Georgenia satyanarayanai TaxID=860221 RepID=UPI00186B1F23|nr:DedA family protein [Georgenia satyanarayanai]
MVAIESWVLGMADSPWLLVAVLALATIDGFFPPVPSESVVIGVAVLAMTGEGPNLWLLILVAAVGAFTGDLIAYTIGSRVPIDRLRIFQGRRGRASLAWARRALAQRGTVLILSARFIPIGRVAVNMTAGAVAFPRPRFILIAAIAAIVWGGYSTALGIGAGVFLHDHPLVAIAVGVTGGVLIGFVVDAGLRWVHRRFGGKLPESLEVLAPDYVAPPEGEASEQSWDECSSTPG